MELKTSAIELYTNRLRTKELEEQLREEVSKIELNQKERATFLNSIDDELGIGYNLDKLFSSFEKQEMVRFSMEYIEHKNDSCKHFVWFKTERGPDALFGWRLKCKCLECGLKLEGKTSKFRNLINADSTRILNYDNVKECYDSIMDEYDLSFFEGKRNPNEYNPGLIGYLFANAYNRYSNSKKQEDPQKILKLSKLLSDHQVQESIRVH